MTATSAFMYGGGAWLILAAVVFVAVWYRCRKPLSDLDVRLDAAEQDADERERQARRELAAARLARQDRIYGLPAARVTIERDAVILDFPARLRLVKDELDGFGDQADELFPAPLVDAGGMLRGEGLGGTAA